MYIYTISKDLEVLGGAAFSLLCSKDEPPFSIRSWDPSKKPDWESVPLGNDLVVAPETFVCKSEYITLTRASLASTEHIKALLVKDMSEASRLERNDVLVWFPIDHHAIVSWGGHPAKTAPGRLMHGLIHLPKGIEVEVNRKVQESVFTKTVLYRYKVTFDGTNVLIDGKVRAPVLTCA